VAYIFQSIAGLVPQISPSFYTKFFSASLTNLTVLLPESCDCSYYIRRPILAPPPLWLQQQSDLRAHDFARSPDLWRQPTFANIICAWNWRGFAINLAMYGVLRHISVCWRSCEKIEALRERIWMPMTDSIFSAMLFELDWKGDSISDIFTHRFPHA